MGASGHTNAATPIVLAAPPRWAACPGCFPAPECWVNATPTEILATTLFALAVLHTFSVKRFAHWAHQCPSGSIQENLLHFLAETEVVFGLWAATLFAGIAALKGSVHDAVGYIESLNYTEPKFVFVVMVVAATRPVVKLAESFISFIARLLPMTEKNTVENYMVGQCRECHALAFLY